MVVVGEDCAIDAPGIAGRRGLAGTALVHKVRQGQQPADLCGGMGLHALEVCYALLLSVQSAGQRCGYLEHRLVMGVVRCQERLAANISACNRLPVPRRRLALHWRRLRQLRAA
jgi:hypothetical protein